jgi:hypothetical protein
MSEKAMSASEKKKEDWMNSKWRPLMGYMYMAVCVADFILFPVLWSLVQAVHGGSVQTQWQPITLAGAGLFHVALGAILGVAAFGRTQEKIAGANNGGITSPAGFSTPGSNFTPAPVIQPAQSTPSPFTAAPSTSGITLSSTGKAMPEQPPMPVL